MLERVAETISRYSMFERGHKVGVAVSGGADSVCLLHVLVELAPRWALRLRVLHLNHRLRGEDSCRDADFVRELAASLGLEADIEEADVGRLRAASGENLEQLGRQVRREFFRDRLNAGAVDRVALGHTLRDQTETVLFRFLRGSGNTGMAGILPLTREGFVRPLLEVDREAVESYLRERNISWREDASNLDPVFARNRIRHELLPALMRDWNPALPEALAHMAALALDEEEYWDREIDRVGTRLCIGQGPAVLLRAEDLRALARPVARRLVRRVIADVKGDIKGIEFKHIEAALGLAERADGEGGTGVPGVEMRRSFGWLRVAPPENRPTGGIVCPTESEALAMQCGTDDFVCQFDIAGKFRLTLELVDGGEAGDAALDWDRLPRPLVLRGWRPGDRYQPVGSVGPKSLKALFQQHKTPSWERKDWPILMGGESIVWTRGFGPAAEYAAGTLAKRVLRISETQELRSAGNPNGAV